MNINWAAPFEFHTPPMEDFEKCTAGGVRIFKCIYPLCDFLIKFEGVKILFRSAKINELIYLEFKLPLSKCFLNLPQGVCGIQMELPINKYCV